MVNWVTRKYPIMHLFPLLEISIIILLANAVKQSRIYHCYPWQSKSKMGIFYTGRCRY